MRYFLQLVALVWFFMMGLGTTILFAIRYGPFAVLGVIAFFFAFFYWKNEARKHGHPELIATGNTIGARKRALEWFVQEVRDKNVEN